MITQHQNRIITQDKTIQTDKVKALIHQFKKM
jgi:hypothetical protein